MLSRVRSPGLYLVAALFMALACQGPAGDTGPEGPKGPKGWTGPQGDPGPVLDPPAITQMIPDAGTWRTRITIKGEFFDAEPANNRVFFDGYEADVLSAAADQLVVTNVHPSVTDVTPVDVTVLTNNQASNAFLFDVVPRGFEEPMEVADMVGAEDVVLDEATSSAWIAAPMRGILKADLATGTTRFIVRLSDGLFGPTALTSNGDGGVYFTDFDEDTTLYAIMEVTADGKLYQVSSLRYGEPRGIARDAAGNLYVADNDYAQVLRFQPDGAVYTWTWSFGSGADLQDLDILGNKIYVTDRNNYGRIWWGSTQTSGTATLMLDYGTDGDPIYWPQAIVAGPGTTLYVSNSSSVHYPTYIAAIDVTGPTVTTYGSYDYVGYSMGLTLSSTGELVGVTNSQLFEANAAATDRTLRATSLAGLSRVAETNEGLVGTACYNVCALVEVQPNGQVRMIDEITWAASDVLTLPDGHVLFLTSSAAMSVDPKDGATQTIMDTSDGLTNWVSAALDPQGDLVCSVYDTDASRWILARSKADGTAIDKTYQTTIGSSTRLAIHQGKIYYRDYADRTVGRAPLDDPSNMETIVPYTLINSPSSFAFLADHEALINGSYWIAEALGDGNADTLLSTNYSDYWDGGSSMVVTSSNQLILQNWDSQYPLLLVTP